MKCNECKAVEALKQIVAHPNADGACHVQHALDALYTLPADEGQGEDEQMRIAVEVMRPMPIFDGSMRPAAPDTAEWAKDREACERATKGPWVRSVVLVDGSPHHAVYVLRPDGGNGMFIASLCPLRDESSRDDADFIVEARTSLPAALDEIARLRAENERAYRRGVTAALNRVSAMRRFCEAGGQSGDRLRELEALVRALLDGKEGGR